MFQFKSSQIIGARVLSSQGEAAGFSSSGNESIAAAVGLLADGSTNPGGGGKNDESMGPRLECDAVEGCRLCVLDLETPEIFVGVFTGVVSVLGRRSRGTGTGVPVGSRLAWLIELLLTEPP